jgi:phospholipid/cholesterol/gamma-HCH transport system substrate-binding protein
MTAPKNKPRTPRYKTAGLVLIALMVAVVVIVYAQFRGDFTAKTPLTMIAARAGLLMDPGSKVTFNGVDIGRVAAVNAAQINGIERARFRLEVNPKFVDLIPANVHAEIRAPTVFGNKYVALSSPKDPSPQPISPRDIIDATAVTTEFNTLFETITSIAEKIDPIKLNITLSAAAEALGGLGAKFGRSLVNGNAILADLNPLMPQIRYDAQRLADLAEIYTAGSQDLWAFLRNAITTSRTFTAEQGDVDAALLAAVGFGNAGADIFTRGAPYLVRGAADLTPTAALLDKYSPQIFCGVRDIAEVVPKVKAALGNNSLMASSQLLGSENPYIYPDNLPRVNAKGGPGGRPGCWATITRDLWPAPYLVMDTGASIAPYNHFEFGQPQFTEYVWGRQWGEDTINP